jgi:hypothetical protein
MRRLRAPVVVIVLAAACGGKSPTSPSAAANGLTETIASAHYVFRYAAGDGVDVERQEAYHAWMVGALGVSPGVIQYNKYNSRDHMGSITGHGNTNAYAEPSRSTIHTIWRFDNHEVVHVCAGNWGSPIALVGEGFAVAHQVDPLGGDFVAKWSGTPIHEIARQQRAAGQLWPIAELADTATFRARDSRITYPVGGSFIRFLIDTEGLAAMRRLYGSTGPTPSLAAIRDAFERVYGFPLDEAERRWHAFLDAGRF